MNRLVMYLCSALVIVVSPLNAQRGAANQQAAKPKPACSLENKIEAATTSYQDFGGSEIIHLGGGVERKRVRIACAKDETVLTSDSLVALNGYDNVTAIGKVKYVDAKYDIVSDTLIRYEKDGGRVELRGNVRVLDRKTGSTLVGPRADYFPAATARDTARVNASDRPTVTMVPEPGPRQKGPLSPYKITADRIQGWGNDKVKASGTVIVERDSLRASGDSLDYASGKNRMFKIFGPPAVVQRTGKDSVRVRGSQVLVAFTEDEKVQNIHSYGDATIFRDGATVTGDTVQMNLDGDELRSIAAWGKGKRGQLKREGYDAEGDSVIVETLSGGAIREVRAVGRGKVFQPLDTTIRRAPNDSTPIERNWLSGNLVTVAFIQVDSAGTQITRVENLIASQAGVKTPSCSYTTTEAAEPPAGGVRELPSIDYACADKIVVTMKPGTNGDVGDVALLGNLNSIRLTPGKPTAPAPVIRP